MRKDVAISLKQKAEQIAIKFSNTARENNYNNESFKVLEIMPISAQGAYVIYEKSTGKRAIAHFIHVDHPKSPFWQYYMIGSQHLLNLNVLTEKYLEVEQHNFPFNFDKNQTIRDTAEMEEVADVLQPFPNQI